MLHQYKHNTYLFDETMPPASALAFHPVQPLLAMSTFSKAVTMYAPPGHFSAAT